MPNSEFQFYIIATPIGNLEDITYRAIRVLSEVDVILCEDTRTTRKLLDHYNITTTTESYHAQSSEQKTRSIIERVQSGTIFALVSDAGTPTISDPGSQLIHELRHAIDAVQIISVPGASALITALSTSGFFGNQFTFYGFLPHKKGRQKIFKEIAESDRISVCYESPHRILKTLSALQEILEPERLIVLARELTKLYEESRRGTIAEIYEYYQAHPDTLRGEMVLVIDKKS